MSRHAFRFGRLAAHDLAAVERLLGKAEARAPETLARIVDLRARQLADYQDAALAERYRARCAIAEGSSATSAGRDRSRRGGGARLLTSCSPTRTSTRSRAFHRPALREGARGAVRGRAPHRVPHGAAAARPRRTRTRRRAAQGALRPVAAAGASVSWRGQAAARHRAGTCSAIRPSAGSSGR